MKKTKYFLIVIFLIAILFLSWKLLLNKHKSIDYDITINIVSQEKEILRTITVIECELYFNFNYNYYIKSDEDQYYHLSTSNLNTKEQKKLLNKIQSKQESLTIEAIWGSQGVSLVTTNGKTVSYTHLELINYTSRNKK